MVTFRVAAEISVPKLETPELEAGDGDASRAFKGERQLYDVDRAVFEAAHIYDRAKLLAGDRLSGPAIVEQFDSTTVVRAGQAVEVDHRGNLIIDTGAAT